MSCLVSDLALAPSYGPSFPHVNDPKFRRHILIVEDDVRIAAILTDYLGAAGYSTAIARDGQAALTIVQDKTPAAITLDLGLPGLDGFGVCRAIRDFCDAPILMITAQIDEAHRVQGLDLGADDYVAKPFSAREVVARIGALIRRAEGRMVGDSAAAGQASVDQRGQRIAWRGQWLGLSRSEYQILSALMLHPGRVFSRDMLLDQLSERSVEPSDRAIDSHVKNIRRKMAAVDPNSDCVVAVYGSGYRFIA